MLQLAFGLLLLATQQQSELFIRADRQDWEDRIWRGTGNVLVKYLDVQVEADWATLDDTTKDLKAGDHVRFTRGEEHLEAGRIEMNLDTKAGTLTDASGEVGPGFFITAAEAHRTEDGRYELKNATVTSCDEPIPGWTLAFARAVIDTNKRITARNSIFRLERVPLFYLPYTIVPTRDQDRSTGFLMPSPSNSTSKGRGLRESFYYAINRSADATFTGEYFSKRGASGKIEFKAVPKADSRVEVNTFFARDRKGQGGWSSRILTYADLARGVRGVADMNLVSSIVFRQVFEEGFNIISSPIEHSLGFLTQNTSNGSMNVLYSRQGVFFVDQPTVVLRRFPALEVSIPDKLFGNLPLYFSAEGGFSGFSRRDASIKTPTFSERFDLHPNIELPIVRSSAFDWSQRFGVRETFYTHSRKTQGEGGMLNRFSFDYSSQFAGPQLERDFGSFKHVIEPSIEYRYITGANRFRQTIVVDDVDLRTNTNEIEYGITNRFFTKREIFSWRLSQKYFFDPTFGGAIIPGRRNVFSPVLDISGFAFADGLRRFSPIVSTMRLSTTASSSTELQVDYDTRNRLFRSAGIIGGLNKGQAFGSVSYFFTRRSAIQIPNNQLRGTLGFGNDRKRGLSAAFSGSYDIERSLFQGSVSQVGYNTDCYGLSFEFSQFDIGARKESRFRFAFSLKNVGSLGTLRRQERLF